MMPIVKSELEKLKFLDGLLYDKEHTWAMSEGELVKVGITDFAQSQLGDIIFVELPQAGEFFRQGEVFGQAESAKSVSALHMPLSGEIVSVNKEVEDSPELVNTHPYSEGWMIIVKPRDLAELKELLSKDDYLHLLQES